MKLNKEQSYTVIGLGLVVGALSYKGVTSAKEIGKTIVDGVGHTFASHAPRAPVALPVLTGEAAQCATPMDEYLLAVGESLNKRRTRDTDLKADAFNFLTPTWHATVRECAPDTFASKSIEEVDALRFTTGQFKRDMVACFTARNAKALKHFTGADPTWEQLYVAHNDGARDASDMIQYPESKAVDFLFSSMMPAYRKSRAMSAWGGNVDMSAGEFMNVQLSHYKGPTGPATP